MLFNSILLCSFVIFGQGITFEVEKLSKPDYLLSLKSPDAVFKELILKEIKTSLNDIKRNSLNIDYGIIATSQVPNSLVTFEYNSFFYGMYLAYANHRPFVLSPDMIWLLISQGFAHHIASAPEKYRSYFVNFEGRKSLIITTKNDLLSANTSDREAIFPKFSEQIASITGQKLIDNLTSDFSTTTATEKMASHITVMEALKPYFEYVVMHIVCGIPEITLRGTTEDWKKVLNKAQSLRQYDLKWWIDEIEPLLREFVKASQGKVDKRFWQNIFKYHSQEKYGAPKIIDGWIVKFFPYDKTGKRNNLKELTGGDNLPDEIVKVDVRYIQTDGIRTTETPLELWEGFIGLEQDANNFTLTPKIGWMIKKKDVEQKMHLEELKRNNDSFGIILSVDKVPEILQKMTKIESLSLYFNTEVFIPEWMKDIEIKKLTIKGKISEQEQKKIIDWFKHIDLLIINRNTMINNQGK